MQDYPKLAFEAQKQIQVNPTFLVVTFPRFMAWSPVKNDYQRAAILYEKTGFEESPRSGEADILSFFKQQMMSVNTCPVCNPEGKQRILIEEGAYVCLWPEAGVTCEELHNHIGENVVIKKGSVVVIRCRNWFLTNVIVEGCLILGEEGNLLNADSESSITLSNVHVKNQGWRYEMINPEDLEYSVIYRMRGYYVKRNESLLINIKSKGQCCIQKRDFVGNERIEW